MHCKHCSGPVQSGGPDTYFCQSCQRILSAADVLPDNGDPQTEMPALSLEKPDQSEQPIQDAAQEEIYHKVCRVCGSRVDHSGDNSYYCPQCGMFKDASGVKNSSERILPLPADRTGSGGIMPQGTIGSVPPSSLQTKPLSVGVVFSSVIAIIMITFTAFARALAGSVSIFSFILLAWLWRQYIQSGTPRSVPKLIFAIVGTLAVAVCAMISLAISGLLI